MPFHLESKNPLKASINSCIKGIEAGANSTEVIVLLKKLDGIYSNRLKTDVEGAHDQVISTASDLFLKPQVFENLNFHSSLLDDGSKFFAAVIRKMGELGAVNPDLLGEFMLPVRIRLVEHFAEAETAPQ